jgi:hypothetical protein
MGLRYCPDCQSVEGKIEYTEEGEMICGECDSTEELQSIPEHDDGDMER